MGVKLYKITVKIFFAIFFASGLLWRCANIALPQGGPRDSLPPRIMLMTPDYGMVNFKEKRIYIEFDEYVTLKDQQKEFYVSPFMERQPTLSLRGRGVQIDFKDTLLENQTYSLNFCSSIRDNNEGNVLNDFRYVFSTGATVDSMLMSGYTVDAYTRDSISKTYILFYEAERDTTPDYDSLLFKPAAAVARAQANGLFIAENLKPIPYRVYAMHDANDNRRYEPGIDKVAFLDSVYNPLNMPGFEIRYDTTRKYNVPDPQLYFRLFMDEAFKRQYLKQSARPIQHRIDMIFGAKYPVIEHLSFEGIDSARIITQYLKPTRDSIHLWLNMPSAELPDTIKGSITYLKHDSTNTLHPVTEKLVLGWKYFEPKKNKNDTLPPENPFKYKVNASAELNPFKNIPFDFEVPLTKIDSTNITLTRIEEENRRYRARFRFERDSVNMLHWILKSEWVPSAKYELVIPAGAFVNVSEQKNDTLKATFTVLPIEKFATISLNVIGKSPTSEYILQIIDPSGRLLREKQHATQGVHTFEYLESGSVRIRVIEDINGNGEWDGGNLIKRIQPERAEIFAQDKGEPEIVLKEYRTFEYDLNMANLFAPVTMQSMMQQLMEMEQARIRKMIKQKAEQQSKPKASTGGSGIGIGTIGSSGLPMPTR